MLQRASFGKRVAEEEAHELERYFVQTTQWKRLHSGEVDVVYGSKGSGKSALYSLLVQKTSSLRSAGIVLVSGENPQGQTAFQNLAHDPPSSQPEFRIMWKLYLLSLLADVLITEEISAPIAETVINAVEDLGLRQPRTNLSGLVRNVKKLASRWLSADEVEGGIRVDAAGQFSGFTVRVAPGASMGPLSPNDVSLDDLLRLCDRALGSQNLKAWIALDRLDVAFEESPDLEANALRALFRVYLDIQGLEQIKLKIFLRTDIWGRITDEGFPESSHITRTTTISWDRSSLLNLLIRRASQNDAIAHYIGVPDGLFDSQSEQENFFYKLFPAQVEPGENKPTTLDWMLGRTRDGSKANAPRELIHLANAACEKEATRVQMGQVDDGSDSLISRVALKEALPEVSQTRVDTVLFGEYPALKPYLQELRRQKTRQTLETLSLIWKIDENETGRIVDRLVRVGFFERQGPREKPDYWVPFLYRSALEMVQGRAARGSDDVADYQNPDDEDD